MASKQPIARPTTASIHSYTRKNAEFLGEQKNAGSHHHQPSETVREAEYNGHRIVVRTTYQIAVDDKPIEGHLAVTNDGHVHYHPIPNLSFASAIDLVKQLIDVFPDDFGNAPASPEHHHGHVAADESGKPKREAASKPKKIDNNGNTE